MSLNLGKVKWAVTASLALIIIVTGTYQLGLIARIYNLIRPAFLNGGGEQCLEQLTKLNVQFRPLVTIEDDKCRIENPVRISRFQETTLSSPILLSCQTALDLAVLFKEAEAHHVVHLGTYNCRSMRRSTFVSEHGFGTAIDIAKINQASISQDWGQNTAKGIFLNRFSRSACTSFNNVLTPDSDSNHYDHLHLDQGPGLGC